MNHEEAELRDLCQKSGRERQISNLLILEGVRLERRGKIVAGPGEGSHRIGKMPTCWHYLN
jgi:hypothetical protein